VLGVPVILSNFPAPSTEQQALAALSQRHRASLQRYFLRRVSNQGDVEDMIQEVFLRLMRRADLQSIGYLDGYLYEIAASVFQDRLRRRRARAMHLHDEFQDNHSPQDFSPERVLIGRESIGRVAQALTELPERVRTAFAMHRFEGLRPPEIAQRIGVSVSAVEKYVIRAQRFVRKRLDDDT
jgi:RNA polymerase sigma factor (sigma-70 family)